ncbi:MAG: hypothetical protein ABEI52_03365, partial [Halobacteriaceae archaeon]
EPHLVRKGQFGFLQSTCIAARRTLALHSCTALLAGPADHEDRGGCAAFVAFFVRRRALFVFVFVLGILGASTTFGDVVII